MSLPYIKSVQIRYFRSLYKARLDFNGNLNIITGSNNAGKSNLLKALNLFFNGETEWQEALNFLRDYSNQRSNEAKRRNPKTRPSISIAVTFSRGDFFEDALPATFTVTKTWFDGDHKEKISIYSGRQDPESKFSLESAYILQIVEIFLSRHRYVYIPAIKDLNVFQGLMKHLHRSIFELDEKIHKSFDNEVEGFNRYLKVTTESLRKDFSLATDISLNFSLPRSLPDLFQSILITTMQAEQVGTSMNIDALGDGLRLRMIPTILDYIAKKSKHRFLWGFEEPENSMEFRIASQMFQRCADEYRKSSQIFITTHSPAFISVDDPRCSLYRAIKAGGTTTITNVAHPHATDIDDLTLAEELGHISLMSQLRNLMHRKIAEAEEAKVYTKQFEAQAAELEERIKRFSKPVVITEGKTDVMILSTAWSKLFPNQNAPFDITSCDTTPENISTGGSAGVGTLTKHLCSVIPSVSTLKIGIFDNDGDGKKAFQLDRNFEIFPEKDWIKVHKNRRAYALLLPPIPEKQDWVEAENLSIEFMFDEEFLKTKIDDYGLVLKPGLLIMKFGSITVESSLSDQLQFMKVDSDSKMGFAEHVVPTLPERAFQNFKTVFDNILEIISVSTSDEEPVGIHTSSVKGKVEKKPPKTKLDKTNVATQLTELTEGTFNSLESEYEHQLTQSIFLLNCNPHPIVDAYSHSLQEKVSIAELQKQYGEKNVSVLLRFRLIDFDGQPQIPLWSNSTNAKSIVRGAASRHEVIEFVRPLIREDPLVSPKSIGDSVAKKFGITSWTGGSKHKIGGSLRSWVLWLEEEEKDPEKPMTEDDIINEILSNGGISPDIRLLLSDGSHRSHGRRPVLNELGMRVMRRMVLDYGIMKGKVADLLNIGHSTVYKYFPKSEGPER
nr:AAA family ATPase [Skermanella stibiiresistens]